MLFHDDSETREDIYGDDHLSGDQEEDVDEWNYDCDLRPLCLSAEGSAC